MAAPDDDIDLTTALRTVAFMGDLSMGQPIDHSPRVASLAAALAQQLGWGDAAMVQAQQIALLRWSGCTANAAEIADTISDDVAGRAAMLALQFDKIEFQVQPEAIAQRATLTSTIHCEVSSLIANALALDPAVADALGCVFEHWDGSGHPNGLHGEAIPASAMVVTLCSELEIFARVHGLPAALALMRQRADRVYPASLVDIVCAHAAHWLSAIPAAPDSADDPAATLTLKWDLIGHVIDLKLPWLTGFSHSVVGLADAMAANLGLPAKRRATLRRAGWLQGLGRVAIPNAVWCRPGPLSTADWERVRLAPYWTSRAARQVSPLAFEAEIASQVYERLDGSGYFRASVQRGPAMDSGILAAAVAWVAMRSERPWRPALSAEAAMSALQDDVKHQRLDPQVISALASCVSPPQASTSPRAKASTLLTARELEVLQRISLGESNKLAAQCLGISPSTVRTHLESAFKKLKCKTRAACTLQASLLGLLDR